MEGVVYIRLQSLRCEENGGFSGPKESSVERTREAGGKIITLLCQIRSLFRKVTCLVMPINGVVVAITTWAAKPT